MLFLGPGLSVARSDGPSDASVVCGAVACDVPREGGRLEPPRDERLASDATLLALTRLLLYTRGSPRLLLPWLIWLPPL